MGHLLEKIDWAWLHTLNTLWNCVIFGLGFLILFCSIFRIQSLFSISRCNLNTQNAPSVAQNADWNSEHSCHSPYFLFLLLHLFSPSFKSLLHSLATFSSPLLVSTDYIPLSLLFSYFPPLLLLSLSLCLSLRDQMCSWYDLFRDRDWGWESLLEAGCSLLKLKWLSMFPTLISDANELSSFICIMLFFF